MVLLSFVCGLLGELASPVGSKYRQIFSLLRRLRGGLLLRAGLGEEAVHDDEVQPLRAGPHGFGHRSHPDHHRQGGDGILLLQQFQPLLVL